MSLLRAASASQPRPRFALFALLSWLHMLVQTWPYLRAGLSSGIGVNLPTTFHVLSWLSYSFLYLLPALILLFAVSRLLPRASTTLAIVAVISTVLSLLFIQADRTIYDLYNFHFNGFVVNLLLTPGGIDSLGSGTDTYISIAGIAARVILIQIAAYVICARFTTTQRRHWKRWSLAAFMASMFLQSATYGICDIYNNGAVLDTAQVYPFYKRITFRGVAEKFGIKADRQEGVKATVDTSRLNYPLQPVQFAEVKQPPNIVLLVAESLRWDRLTPEIMPNTFALAQRAQHFTQHYSSGNGTREGLFGMFYGLYGSYWSNFLHSQRGPLLMDRVQALNYQLDLRTSARFSYPEFNKTLFASVPLQVQHESDDNLTAWQNDEANASALMDFISKRDRARPFMSFFFFESTHARYTFPDSAIIAKPFLEDVNYGDMSKESLAPKIGQLLNRYTNSAHWIDVQMGRIYTYLEQNNLLDNTIVIVTGDHGEEFLEKGFWGHNSSFVEEQTHTPMVVWMPGMGHADINRMTSHMDIGTTLLQQLGAPAETKNYSLGRNLFDESPRPYIVVSDWHSISVRTDAMKYRIPYTNRGTDHWQPTTAEDGVLAEADSARLLSENRGTILDAIQNCSAFSRKSTAPQSVTAQQTASAAAHR